MWIALGTTFVIGVAAAITDIKFGKIPNLLLLIGVIIGLLNNFIFNPLPVPEHILRTLICIIVFFVGSLHLLGMGDIKLWMTETILLGAMKSTLIVLFAGILSVIVTVTRDKSAFRTLMATTVDMMQNKSLRKEVIEMDKRTYPFAFFMMFPLFGVCIYDVIKAVVA